MSKIDRMHNSSTCNYKNDMLGFMQSGHGVRAPFLIIFTMWAIHMTIIHHIRPVNIQISLGIRQMGQEPLLPT